MLDLILLLKICQGNEKKILLNELKEEYFREEYRDHFNYCIEYLKTHKKIPEAETFIHDRKINIPSGLSANEPTSYYLEKLQKGYVGQEIKKEIKKILEVNHENPFEALEVMRESVRTLSAQSRIYNKKNAVDWTSLEEAKKRISLHVEKLKKTGLQGIPTPWQSINKETQGICPNTFWVIVAKLKTGKTWELFYLALHCWAQKYKVLIISPEVALNDSGERLDATRFRIPYENLRSGSMSQTTNEIYYEKLLRLNEENNPLWIAADGAVDSINDIEALYEKHEPDIIFLDSMYIIHPSGKKRADKHERVSALCEELEKFVKRTGNVRLVATTQFNRGVGEEDIEGGSGKLGFAYDIGQYCDVLLGMYKNNYMRQNKLIAIRLEENRAGDKINILSKFDMGLMDFGEIGTFEGNSYNNITKTDPNGTFFLNDKINIEEPTLEMLKNIMPE